ncbi:chromosomal protein D1 [Culicoides brevitarsis]|uniref:chromosomal protein D1 n=1 Tax=Culicoides brevitarsis TaxID=469753 RepID=UPI00307B2E5C
MDTSVEEQNSPTECCIACLTKDENKLSNANAAGLLKDFLPQRNLSHLFKYIPAQLCTECLTQMESHINFKLCVENSIQELENGLPDKPKGRGRPKKPEGEKKAKPLQNGNHGRRGRPRKSDLEPKDDYEDESERSTANAGDSPPKAKGKRGRPVGWRKSTNGDTSMGNGSTPGRGRGRPPKHIDDDSSNEGNFSPAPKSTGKRGRPVGWRKSTSDSNVKIKIAVPGSSGRKAGRPRKSETAYNDGDDNEDDSSSNELQDDEDGKRKRKTLYFDIDSDDSDALVAKKKKAASTSGGSSSGKKRGRPKKVDDEEKDADVEQAPSVPDPLATPEKDEEEEEEEEEEAADNAESEKIPSYF